MTKDERTFLDRAAAMLLERNPDLTAGSEITADMMDQAMRDTLARDQALLNAAQECSELRDVICLHAYNGARMAALKADNKRRMDDEAKAASLRISQKSHELGHNNA